MCMQERTIAISNALHVKHFEDQYIVLCVYTGLTKQRSTLFLLRLRLYFYTVESYIQAILNRETTSQIMQSTVAIQFTSAVLKMPF